MRGCACCLVQFGLAGTRPWNTWPTRGCGVEELARRHHLSVRGAYTLFERIGTTPGAYLREQRLLAAQAMLSDPRCAHLGISGIAAAVGILHLRTFERVFRRQYGMTPPQLAP